MKAEASCQHGEPCGDPDNCPDPVGCGFVPPDMFMEYREGSRLDKWMLLTRLVDATREANRFPECFDSLRRYWKRSWL